MNIKHRLKNYLIKVTFKMPLVSIILAIITISLLYMVASKTYVGVYKSYKGDLKYVKGRASIEVVASEFRDQKLRILDSVFYQNGVGIRYTCTYICSKEIKDDHMLVFAVDDTNYHKNSDQITQVNVDIKTESISLVQKLLSDRSN